MITDDQKEFYKNNGYLVLPNLLSTERCDLLKDHIHEIIAGTNYDQRHTVNNTDYFRQSTNSISIFWNDKSKTVDKVGHALHKNKIFGDVIHNQVFRQIASDLNVDDAVIAQSMYLFKNPGSQQTVYPHQDSTFLHTTPLSCLGFWIALDDVTIQNGCLHVIPGSHETPIITRYEYKNGKNVFNPPLGTFFWSSNHYIPLPVSRGSLILLHGSLVHKSHTNNTNTFRDVLTFHIVSQSANWSTSNWHHCPDFDKL